MSEKVSIDSDVGVVVIDLFTSDRLQDLSKSLDTALQLANNLKLSKVLVDATALRVKPSLIELHQFASILSERTIGFRHALVLPCLSETDIRHIDNVAHNRGSTINIFTSRDDALSWLKPERLAVNGH